MTFARVFKGLPPIVAVGLILTSSMAMGAVRGTATTVPTSTGGGVRYPDAAYDAVNNVFLAVTGKKKVQGRFLSASGALLGSYVQSHDLRSRSSKHRVRTAARASASSSGTRATAGQRRWRGSSAIPMGSCRPPSRSAPRDRCGRWALESRIRRPRTSSWWPGMATTAVVTTSGSHGSLPAARS